MFWSILLLRVYLPPSYWNWTQEVDVVYWTQEVDVVSWSKDLQMSWVNWKHYAKFSSSNIRNDTGIVFSKFVRHNSG